MSEENNHEPVRVLKRCYAIRDDKAGFFGFPVVGDNDSVMVRSFGDMILHSEGKSLYSLHPSDFSLWFLGLYDDISGMFGQSEAAMVKLASGSDDPEKTSRRFFQDFHVHVVTGKLHIAESQINCLVDTVSPFFYYIKLFHLFNSFARSYRFLLHRVFLLLCSLLSEHHETEVDEDLYELTYKPIKRKPGRV